MKVVEKRIKAQPDYRFEKTTFTERHTGKPSNKKYVEVALPKGNQWLGSTVFLMWDDFLSKYDVDFDTKTCQLKRAHYVPLYEVFEATQVQDGSGDWKLVGNMGHCYIRTSEAFLNMYEEVK